MSPDITTATTSSSGSIYNDASTTSSPVTASSSNFGARSCQSTDVVSTTGRSSLATSATSTDTPSVGYQPTDTGLATGGQSVPVAGNTSRAILDYHIMLQDPSSRGALIARMNVLENLLKMAPTKDDGPSDTSLSNSSGGNTPAGAAQARVSVIDTADATGTTTGSNISVGSSQDLPEVVCPGGFTPYNEQYCSRAAREETFDSFAFSKDGKFTKTNLADYGFYKSDDKKFSVFCCTNIAHRIEDNSDLELYTSLFAMHNELLTEEIARRGGAEYHCKYLDAVKQARNLDNDGGTLAGATGGAESTETTNTGVYVNFEKPGYKSKLEIFVKILKDSEENVRLAMQKTCRNDAGRENYDEFTWDLYDVKEELEKIKINTQTTSTTDSTIAANGYNEADLEITLWEKLPYKNTEDEVEKSTKRFRDFIVAQRKQIEKFKDIKLELKCSVCLDQTMSNAIQCGHLSTCDTCLPHVIKCPICREHKTHLVQANFAGILGYEENRVFKKAGNIDHASGTPTGATGGSDSSDLSEKSYMDLKNLARNNNTIIKELAARNRAKKAVARCIVCEKDDPKIAFHPCGHFAVCEKCADTTKLCPVCKKQVEGKNRVYLEGHFARS